MIRKKLGMLLGILAGIAAGASSGYGATLILEDFQIPHPETYWNFRATKTEVLSGDEGNQLQLTYPKWSEGQERWPAAILECGSGKFQTADWRGYAAFAMTVFNESADFTIRFRLDDAHGNQYGTSFFLPKGEETVCIIPIRELAERLDVTQMVRWDLWLEMPPENRVIRLSDIRLADEPYTHRNVTALCRRQLKRLETAVQQLQATQGTAYTDQLLTDIEQWQAIFTAPEHRSAKIAASREPRLEQLEQLTLAAAFFAGCQDDFTVYPVAPTRKFRQNQVPETAVPETEIRLDAARGEAESRQLLVFANRKPLREVTYHSTPLTDEAGNQLFPELSVVGYVPVANPTRPGYGFGLRGDYPDILLPNQPFEVPAFHNQALWFSVWVPVNAAPGCYRGLITVTAANAPEIKLPVTLQVYAATIPKLGKLKTSWSYHAILARPEYYGADWTAELADAFIRQNLKYRFSVDRFAYDMTLDLPDTLPWNRVFQVDDGGNVAADWQEFDRRVEYWLAQGKNTFKNYYPGWLDKKSNLAAPAIEAQKLQLISRHLAEKGWADYFYLYVFDEPPPGEADNIKEVCDWIHRQGDNLNVILTSCHDNESEYVGYADIFVPHINVYDPAFGAERQAAGDQYWMYTCIGTAFTTYPDTWKIDSCGTAHRAIGWWLYKYGAQGYLYWELDWWWKNPWETAETFPNGNGDGSMFYPAPDRQSLPYPSIRAELTRDGFEDYELLHLLAERYAGNPPDEVNTLLTAAEIIEAPDRYHQAGDDDFIRLHRRLLELLD